MAGYAVRWSWECRALCDGCIRQDTLHKVFPHKDIPSNVTFCVSMEKDALYNLSQRFDCGNRNSTISIWWDMFNSLILLSTRESYILTGTRPGIGCEYPILNRPGNDGTSSGRSNGGYSLPPCTSSSGTSRTSSKRCKYFSNLYGDATSCTYISYSGEVSNIYQGRYFNVHELRFYPAVYVCTSLTKMVIRVVLLRRVRCKQLDEVRKWTGTYSLCQLPRNEHSDSLELSSSAQVRTIDGSNAEAKNYIELLTVMQFDGCGCFLRSWDYVRDSRGTSNQSNT